MQDTVLFTTGDMSGGVQHTGGNVSTACLAIGLPFFIHNEDHTVKSKQPNHSKGVTMKTVRSHPVKREEKVEWSQCA